MLPAADPGARSECSYASYLPLPTAALWLPRASALRACLLCMLLLDAPSPPLLLAEFIDRCALNLWRMEFAKERLPLVV